MRENVLQNCKWEWKEETYYTLRQIIQNKLGLAIVCILLITYLTPGSSRTLAVMSTASARSFSTSCKRSHSSFLGPRIPFFDLRPCFIICSKTMKKCCKGMWSESNWWPNRRLESRTSLITNFSMFTRLLFSICMGSRSVTKKRREVGWRK